MIHAIESWNPTDPKVRICLGSNLLGMQISLFQARYSSIWRKIRRKIWRHRDGDASLLRHIFPYIPHHDLVGRGCAVLRQRRRQTRRLPGFIWHAKCIIQTDAGNQDVSERPRRECPRCVFGSAREEFSGSSQRGVLFFRHGGSGQVGSLHSVVHAWRMLRHSASGPVYMSRKIRKFRTDKFDTWNKRKFWLMQLM